MAGLLKKDMGANHVTGQIPYVARGLIVMVPMAQQIAPTGICQKLVLELPAIFVPFGTWQPNRTRRPILPRSRANYRSAA